MERVKILGQEYPLCLTVAVLDDLESRGLRLKDIDTLYTTAADRDAHDCIRNSTWLLSRLMLRGCQHAENEGAEDVPVPLPLAVLETALTPGDVLHEVIPAVCRAISDGMTRRIEAQHDGKKAGAEGDSP